MTTQPVGPAGGPSTSAAREAARQDNGQFGTQPRAEGPDLQLVAPTTDATPGSLDGYLPAGYENGGGFADFCGGCGDELTVQGECVACDGPFVEAFRSGSTRYGIVTSGDEVVVETSAYEVVGSFKPGDLGLSGEAKIKEHAQRLAEAHAQIRARE